MTVCNNQHVQVQVVHNFICMYIIMFQSSQSDSDSKWGDRIVILQSDRAFKVWIELKVCGKIAI